MTTMTECFLIIGRRLLPTGIFPAILEHLQHQQHHLSAIQLFWVSFISFHHNSNNRKLLNKNPIGMARRKVSITPCDTNTCMSCQSFSWSFLPLP
jgi:hypothetical protein